MRIESTDLAIGFSGRAPVVSGITLAIRPGEMVGLLGPNGSGKTTLLRTLAGLHPPLAGGVRYDGCLASEIGARVMARRIAFLAQAGEVHWSLEVEALVRLGRLPHRRPWAGPSRADEQAVERALTAADVAGLRERSVGSLSGGERMRVLLARALAVEAGLLLADEPVAALDPLHQLTVMGLLRRAARDGMGVVVVLHDLALAARFCDRLVLLAHGRVLADAEPETVLTDHAVASAYAVEVARGRHRGEAYLLPWVPVSPILPSERPHATA